MDILKIANFINALRPLLTNIKGLNQRRDGKWEYGYRDLDVNELIKELQCDVEEIERMLEE